MLDAMRDRATNIEKMERKDTKSNFIVETDKKFSNMLSHKKVQQPSRLPSSDRKKHGTAVPAMNINNAKTEF